MPMRTDGTMRSNTRTMLRIDKQVVDHQAHAGRGVDHEHQIERIDHARFGIVGELGRGLGLELDRRLDCRCLG